MKKIAFWKFSFLRVVSPATSFVISFLEFFGNPMPPENKKKLFFGLIFDSKQPEYKIFRKFRIFVALGGNQV